MFDLQLPENLASSAGGARHNCSSNTSGLGCRPSASAGAKYLRIGPFLPGSVQYDILGKA